MQTSELRATSFQQVALRDFENSGGERAQRSENFQKNLIFDNKNQKSTYAVLITILYSLYITYKNNFNFFKNALLKKTLKY